MKYRLLAVIAACALVLGACGSDSDDDVATLKTNENTQAESQAEGADPVMDNEAIMMAFTECLREQGLKVADPVVDSDGNMGKPEPLQGDEFDKEAFGAAWEACEHHLERLTFEKKERVDVSELVDQYVALATCLRDKGYDVDDPTAEMLDEWEADFKYAINWDDPDAMTDWEECNVEAFGEDGGK